MLSISSSVTVSGVLSASLAYLNFLTFWVESLSFKYLLVMEIPDVSDEMGVLGGVHIDFGIVS